MITLVDALLLLAGSLIGVMIVFGVAWAIRHK